jgi:hypothetical protein
MVLQIIIIHRLIIPTDFSLLSGRAQLISNNYIDFTVCPNCSELKIYLFKIYGITNNYNTQTHNTY